MRACAVSDPLDQGRAQVAACALCGPGRGGVHGDKVVAVHPQRGNAAAHTAPGEGGGLATGNGLEGRNGPLVIDHVEDHRGAVNVGKGEGSVEIRFGGGAVTDPGRGDFGVALDGRGHAPANGLYELGGQVAGNTEKAVVTHRIHDRQLPTLERVAFVGQQLADQVHQWYIAGHQDALLAVGGEAHVVDVQGQGLGAADGFFAKALHIERHFFLALGDHHARVKNTRLEHGAHAFAQHLARYAFGPGAQGLALVVEHADQAFGQVGGIGRFYVDRRLAHQTGIGQAQVAEVGLAAWAAGGFGNVQAQRCIFIHGFLYARSCRVY